MIRTTTRIRVESHPSCEGLSVGAARRAACPDSWSGLRLPRLRSNAMPAAVAPSAARNEKRRWRLFLTRITAVILSEAKNLCCFPVCERLERGCVETTRSFALLRMTRTWGDACKEQARAAHSTTWRIIPPPRAIRANVLECAPTARSGFGLPGRNW